jgi:hypothetical protein
LYGGEGNCHCEGGGIRNVEGAKSLGSEDVSGALAQ